MKKLLVILLVLTLALGLVGCKKCKDHVDNDVDFKCDECGQDVACVHKDADVDNVCDRCKVTLNADFAYNIARSVANQVRDAKSLRAEILVKLDIADSSWQGDTASPVKYEEKETIDGKIDVTVSRVGDEYGVKIVITGTTVETYDGETETDTTNIEFILVGKTVYMFDSDSGIYEREYISLPINIDGVVEAFAAALEKAFVSEAEKEKAIREIGDLALAFLGIKNYKGEKSLDLKPAIDSLDEYFTKLDLEKAKLGEVLDFLLSKLDPELTSEKLIDEIDATLDLTVTEALDKIDAKLTEAYGTTLQGLYNTLLADEDVVAALSAIIDKSYANEYTKEERKALVDGKLADIKGADIRKLVADAGIGDVSLYDLVITLVSGGEGEPPNKADIVKMVKDTLGLTVAEFEAEGITVVSAIKNFFISLEVSELKASVSVNLTDAFKIDSVGGKIRVNLKTEFDTEYEGKKEVKTFDVDLGVKIYAISSEEVSILPPKDKLEPVSVEDAIRLIGTGMDIDESKEYDLDSELLGVQYFEYGDARVYLKGNPCIDVLEFSYVLDETDPGKAICTVTGFNLKENASIYTTDKSSSLIGGVYDVEALEVYFNGDLDFTVEMDEDGLIDFVEIPVLLPEYILAD